MGEKSNQDKQLRKKNTLVRKRDRERREKGRTEVLKRTKQVKLFSGSA